MPFEPFLLGVGLVFNFLVDISAPKKEHLAPPPPKFPNSPQTPSRPTPPPVLENPPPPKKTLLLEVHGEFVIFATKKIIWMTVCTILAEMMTK